MEILVDSNNKLEIIMRDKDILKISTQKISTKHQLKCIKGVLHFDSISYKELENLENEKQAIKAMNKYLKKNKKEEL